MIKSAKWIVVILLLALVGNNTVSSGFAKPPAKGRMKVFILAGQSNMQGHGRISMKKDGDPIPEPRTDSEFLELAG